jgi:hypothetical protein
VEKVNDSVKTSEKHWFSAMAAMPTGNDFTLSKNLIFHTSALVLAPSLGLT